MLVLSQLNQDVFPLQQPYINMAKKKATTISFEFELFYNRSSRRYGAGHAYKNYSRDGVSYVKIIPKPDLKL